MSDDRTNHVIEAIDGALEDWELSDDAMRWAPPEAVPAPMPRPALVPPPPPPRPPLITRSPEPEYHGLSWARWLRVVEDPAIPRGEAVISVDTEFEDVHAGGAFWRRVPVASTAEARISPILTGEEREELVGRIAAAYAVPVCLIDGHRWSYDEYLPHVRQYRRACTREGCEMFETRSERIPWPERWH